MRRVLDIGKDIYLSSYDYKENRIINKFTIDEVIGFGATCIVYSAHYYDRDKNKYMVRLKEFYPANYDMKRASDNSLIIGDLHLFNEELKRFSDSYKKHIEFQNDENLVNVTSGVQGIYEGNSTKYIVLNYSNGISYEKVKDEGVNDIFKVALSTASVIEKYHEKGYLHLDIKPENILKLKETNDLIMLFDFDSIQLKSDIQNMKIKKISYSEKWAAPELLQGNCRLICEATDIYSIGAMVFNKIMGREVNSSDRSIFSSWEFEISALEGCNPRILNNLEEFFHKTLCSSPKYRYRNTKEICQALSILVEYSDVKAMFLNSNLLKEEAYFLGREEELNKIEKIIFNESNFVFLHGIGGIGKSELAKKFYRLYEDSFHTIVFARFNKSLKELMVSDKELPIVNFTRLQGEDDDSYYERKTRKLSEIVDLKTLIIIDNFDVDSDDNLDDLLKCNCKFIFTSRNDFSGYGFPQIEISEIEDMDILKNIFFHYYKKQCTEEDEKIIVDIINSLYAHTMTVELIAKQMMVSRIKPKEMWAKLNSVGIGKIARERIRHLKDNKLNNKTMQEHIYSVFDLSEMTEQEKYILMNLVLVPHVGIGIEEFAEWLQLESYEDINKLIDKGWIKASEDDVLTLHPVISEVVKDKVGIDIEACSGFMVKLIEYIVPEDQDSYLDRMKKLLFGEHLIKFADDIIDYKLEIALQLSYITRINGEYNKSLEYAELCVEFAENDEAYNDDRSRVLENIGYAYAELCKYDLALEAFEKGKAIRVKYYYDDKIEIAKFLHNIAYIYNVKDNIKKAIEYQVEVLAVYQQEFGEKHKDIPVIYNNIASFYGRLGEYEKQLDYLFRSLTCCENGEVISKYSLGLVNGNIGSCYSRLGKSKEAIKYQKKALELRIEVYGEEHPDVALTYNELAQEYIKLGEYDKAYDYGLKAMEMRKKLFGNEHLITADSYNALAYIYYKKGEYEKNIELLEVILNIRRKAHGENHSKVARTYINIGTTKSKQKYYKEAEEYYNKAELIIDSLEYIDCKDKCQLYKLMAENYEDMQNYDKAAIYYKKLSVLEEE